MSARLRASRRWLNECGEIGEPEAKGAQLHDSFGTTCTTRASARIVRLPEPSSSSSSLTLRGTRNPFFTLKSPPTTLFTRFCTRRAFSFLPAATESAEREADTHRTRADEPPRRFVQREGERRLRWKDLLTMANDPLRSVVGS